MRQMKSWGRVAASSAAVVSLTLGLSAATASGAVSARPHAATGTIIAAEGATANPNYIFPYANCNVFSVANMNQFQMLMYRPLYWFGLGASTAYVPSLSVANTPVASNGGKTYTINLKGWKFADGQTVDANSVMFFLNMFEAVPGDYCGYNPGFGIPDQVASASGSGNTVTITFKTAVNANWILYNYLSNITPMPTAWADAAGGAACVTGAFGDSATNAACAKDYKYLDNLSNDTSTWTNSTWEAGTDGPWKLQSDDVLGNETFVPNPTYSGPQKAQVAKFELRAYTSTTAEETDLQNKAIQLGYVDPSDLPGNAPAPGKVGPNVSGIANNYNLTTGSVWGINYIALQYQVSGYNNDAVRDAEMSQLYIRQALQYGIDQPAIISSIDKNYGDPICSPEAPNTPKVIAPTVACAYNFSVSKALALFKSHGWKLEGGYQVCTTASKCGTGIPAGSKVTFDYSYLSAAASPAAARVAHIEMDAWKQIGFNIVGDPQGFNTAVKICRTVDMCSWGGGWTYDPNYYPSGETLFSSTGGFNVGNYSDPKMDALIKAEDFGTAPLSGYLSYAATQLPDLWQPEGTGTGETAKSLKGVQAPNPLENLMPEYLHY